MQNFISQTTILWRLMTVGQIFSQTNFYKCWMFSLFKGHNSAFSGRGSKQNLDRMTFIWKNSSKVSWLQVKIIFSYSQLKFVTQNLQRWMDECTDNSKSIWSPSKWGNKKAVITSHQGSLKTSNSNNKVEQFENWCL